MRSDWEDKKISDLCEFIYGKNLPAKKRNSGGSIPVYGSNGVTGYHDEAYVNEPGLIIGRKGTVGSVEFCDKPFWPIDTTFFIPESSVDNISYLYYLFKSIEFKRVSADSAVPGLNRDAAYSIKVKIPHNPNDRTAIVDVLQVLDNRIKLSIQMCETLEKIASALFKSWFVDFDPVIAKMEGRTPKGMAADLLALFPDSFEESELGEIPKGWEVKAMDEIADFLNGLALQKYPAVEGQPYLPVIKIAEINRGITQQTSKASTDIPKKYIIDDGDVLFSWSGSLTAILWPYGKGALNQHLFKVTSSKYPKWFYYQWVWQHLPFYRMIAASKATTMGHIKRQHLSETKAYVPSALLLKEADKIFAPMLSRIVDLGTEIRCLSNMRDTLLPKLISGELRVEDVGGV